jgi:hypothetical protein
LTFCFGRCAKVALYRDIGDIGKGTAWCVLGLSRVRALKTIAVMPAKGPLSVLKTHFVLRPDRFMSYAGPSDLNVVIRTAVVTSVGVTIGTGGAITFLSDPEVSQPPAPLPLPPQPPSFLLPLHLTLRNSNTHAHTGTHTLTHKHTHAGGARRDAIKGPCGHQGHSTGLWHRAPFIA